MSSPPRSSSAPKLASVLNPILLLALLCCASSAAVQKPEMNQAAPKVLEETFAFPPPLQWKLSDIELSVVGLAWGPADSPEMIAKGREAPSREKPSFFPDKTYALAVHFRAYKPQLNQMISQSQLARITDVEGDVEYAWELTPSGFVDVRGATAAFSNVPMRTVEFWDFFPVLPQQSDFLFQVTPFYTKTPSLTFRIVIRGNKLLIINPSPAPEAAVPDFNKKFSGSVGGETAVTWQLTKTGPKLSGTEQYAHTGKTPWLNGAVDSLGNFELKEYYPRDQLTGIFAGKFSKNSAGMTGYFSKPNGSDLQTFELTEVVPPPAVDESSNNNPPCPTPNTPAGWKTYFNPKYGFCFSYPPIYEPVAEPWLEKYTNSAESSKVVQQEAEEGRVATFQHRQKPGLSIGILIGTESFDLQSFVQQAPTGQEGPPEPRDIRGRTFYYYGPGGGGVCYGDQFFYNLRGKPLYIDFDGCVDDKTPPPETKKIEEQMLATFQTF